MSVDYLNPKYLREFDTFESLLVHLETKRPARAPNASEDTNNAPSNHWDFSVGMAGARRLAAHGWPEGRARFVAGMADALTMGRGDVDRPTWVRDVCGARPCVPALLSGQPRSMYRQVKRPAMRPVVTVLVSMSASAGCHADWIANRGIAIASWIDAAENMGQRVELTLCWPCDGVDTRIAVKRAGDALDVDRLAFCLAHPAMFRRIAFAAAERDAKLMAGYGSFYGWPDGYTNLPDGVAYFESIAPRNGEQFGELDVAVRVVNERCNAAVQTNRDYLDGDRLEAFRDASRLK